MVRVYVPVGLGKRVRAAAPDRCGYCQTPQHLCTTRLQYEHIHPRALGGRTVEENLWLSCGACNNYKGDRVVAVDPQTNEEQPLFNPRTQRWSDHFRWDVYGIRVIGLTPIGRATVEVLHLADDELAIEVRTHWVSVGWHPPRD